MGHPSDRVGQTLLGKFKLLRLIGSGGMGAVYEVEHLMTGHRRALKILHAEVSASAESVRRLVRESLIAGKLHSSYLAETYDVGVLDDGTTYLLMELLEGRPLDQVLASEGRLSPPRAAAIARELALGLAEAHDAGIVHRDIKPSNVFLARGPGGEEQVRILDFGIAKFLTALTGRFGALTSDGTILGSPCYMSPEQAGGQADVDARADIYAVGVLLYEMLGGRRPFDGPTPAALILSIHEGTFTDLGATVSTLPPGLTAVVHRAMSRDREARHGSARELAAALEPFIASDPAPAPVTDPKVETPPRAAGSSRVLLGAVLGVGLVGLGGVAIGAYALFRLSDAETTGALSAGAPPAPGVASPQTAADAGASRLGAGSGPDPAGMGGMPPGFDPATMGGMPPGFDPAAMGGTFPEGLEPDALTPEEEAEVEAISRLQMEGRFRECLSRAERMRPTMVTLIHRMSCASAVGDRAAARRACDELIRRSPMMAIPCSQIGGRPPGGARPDRSQTRRP